MALSFCFLRFTNEQMRAATEMPRSAPGFDQTTHSIYYEV